ncbi:hypothetical protein [Roseofilum sp. Belize Diploria]|uniref:hypothetical protein n=1 Tax=Roseofilum sp. Belize Diploria TaxID=2821501 RepID=UPI001B028FC7|nr:hypothetical protein [Roseofilum sp. Belize Diploria]MBP0008054.1 hypothetical protein [Roseofilum sp. Belize Diploria]
MDSSPFLLLISSSLEDPSIREFVEKQQAINNAIRSSVLENINFWEAIDLMEEAFSMSEMDDFFVYLDDVSEEWE